MFSKEYGPLGEVGIDVPAANDILPLCDLEAECEHLLYQLGERMFHVKYGCDIHWNEVIAQVTADLGLRRIFANVRVPKVHHAFRINNATFIVMDHIAGETIESVWEASDNDEKARL